MHAMHTCKHMHVNKEFLSVSSSKGTNICELFVHIPVVPHKAVAEVSKIGNL